MDRWSDGVYLIGQYNFLKVGCWLLTNGKEGALLEMPPSGDRRISLAKDGKKAAEELGVEIQYLLCTHTHGDHFSRRTLVEMRKTFPKAEKYSLTDQIRRSSRSVCSNLAEAFRKRKYPKAFVSKLSDSEGEAAETQVWLDFSLRCRYIKDEIYNELYKQYEYIIGKLVNMSLYPEKWKY